MVTEAQAQRSPTQQFTERFERIFVPSVLVLVVMLLFAGFVIDEPFRPASIAPWRCWWRPALARWPSRCPAPC
jgi:cation transport ATPase